MSFLSELKRRNVFRVGAAYVFGSWLLIQVAETLFPLFGFDETPARIVVIALAIGFIPVLVVSWAFEWTPEGLVRDEEVDRSGPAISAAAKRLDRIVMVVLALALGYFAFDKFVLSGTREAAIAEQARQAGRSEAMAESEDDHSIAVLPFVNMSSDPEQEFFADGMTEEILNILARVPDLRVTARTSSFFFKGKDLPITEIAQALNVRHVLEGSVRKSGDRLRITAQLIEAGSDRHLWSETFDRELEDVFQVQDEVAGSIADALLDSFTGLANKPVSRADNLAAFEAYRTGRLRWWRRSPEDLRGAIELFEQAVASDPGFAPAYAAIADSWLLLGLYGEAQILDARSAALPMIEQALKIDPECAEAHAARGLAEMIIGEFNAAELALREAIRLDENYVPAFVWLGGLLAQLGRVPEEGAILQAALAKDPLNQVLTTNYASNLDSRGDFDGAKQQIEGLLRLQPDSAGLLYSLSHINRTNGQLVEAWKLARQAHELEPDNALAIMELAATWMDLGVDDQADSVMYHGLEHVRKNAEFRVYYLFQLTMQNRVEAAERTLLQVFGPDVSGLPAAIQRTYHFHAALVSNLKNDPASVRDHLEQAINPDESQLWDDRQVFILSTVSLLHRAFGDEERAEQRLATAERVVGHARLNGIDNANIYYQTACLFALRGEDQRAIQAMKLAYDKGWRNLMALDRDPRLDRLRNVPAFQEIRQRISQDVAAARETVIRLAATEV